MSTNKNNTRTLTATQRWQASGFAKPAPLKERLTMLTEIMLRNDLSGLQYRICYYLIAVKTDAETGLCAATDASIANGLGVTPRAVKKAKQGLKDSRILEWQTQRLNGKNLICLYRVILKTEKRVNSRSPSNDLPVHHQNKSNDLPVHHEMVNGWTPSKPNTAFHAKFGSAELDAWDRWSAITTGKSLPRDRAGGWQVATRWPPSHQMELADLLAT
jgi:hypothetical protein